MRFPLERLLPAFAFLATIVTIPAVTEALEIELIARGRLPGDGIDRSGLTDTLADGIPHNLLGGLSALEYSGHGTDYYALPDRGPHDGAVPYRCRFHVIRIELPAQTRLGQQSPAELSIQLRETHLLQSADAIPFVGDSSALGQMIPGHEQRLDPEGLRASSTGHLYLSEEYGPTVREFDARGNLVRDLPVPPHFLVEHPARSKDEEFATNAAGRQPNGGLEGLAISPSGARLFAIMQRPLLQDSLLRDDGKRVGIFNRILEIDTRTGRTREFVYPLASTSNGISEILAVNDQEFLVLERDSEKGAAARFKKIIHTRLGQATDVSHLQSLPADALPTTVIPVQKSDFLDLLDPRFGLAGDSCPEKMEGLTFGPRLADGRSLLIVGIDNDFVAAQPSLFLAFSIAPQLLKRD